MNGNDTPQDMLQPVLAQMQQDGERALASLDELAGLYPDDARLPFLKGSVLAGLERYAEARLAMQKAVRIAPAYALARFQLGLLELSSGEADAARATWGPLLDLPADSVLNLFVRGLEIMLAGDFPAAIALLEDGIARNTDLQPMNRDMGLMIDRMREKLDETDGPGIESGTHFLLRQYSLKDTRH